jgi:hypothetical protein
MRDLLMFSSLSTLLVVTLAILIVLSEGLRRHRIGVTLLACWCSIGVSIYTLRMAGDAIDPDLYFAWYGPLGTWLAAWAFWDVSRLSRQYGTTTMMQAAELARGFLLSDKVADALWSAWAHHLPTPAWVKGPDGVMIAVNRQLETRYGVAEKNYVGSPDSTFFDAAAAAYEDTDRRVFETGLSIVSTEPAPVWNDKARMAVTLKFPVRDKRGHILCVGGIELMRHDETGDAA